MSVFSLVFGAFVLTSLTVYYLLPSRAQNAWLLFASYAFYALWGWQLPATLCLLTLVNWGLARGAVTSRAFLWTAVALDVLAVVALRALSGLGFWPIVGVSFYAMQAISYVADVRSGALRARAGLLDFALYLAWFPRLIAGPIERATTFLPRLTGPRFVDEAAVSLAFARIVEGLFRKIVLADSIERLIPEALFQTPGTLPPGVLVAGLVASTFVLYNEFAGYTSLVRGVSGLFGIELSPNFRQPLFSRSFTEFWTRWHMSLSFWLRDYIYLPLARELIRRDPRPGSLGVAVLPPMAAMLASGFWHGGSAGALVWGAMHGVFLSVERLWALAHPRRHAHRPMWAQAVQMLTVFVLGTLALVPFRSTPWVTLELWGSLFRSAGWSLPDARLLVFAFLTLALDAIEYRAGDVAGMLAWPLPARAAVLAVGLAFLALSAGPVSPPILYQGF